MDKCIDICLDKTVAKTWSTSGVEGNVRFDFWKEFICREILNADCSANKEAASSFGGQISVVGIDDIKIAELHSDPALFFKTKRCITEMKNDHLMMIMRMQEKTRYYVNSNRYVIDSRDINIYHAGREQTLKVEGNVNAITVQVPLHHLAKYTRDPERYNNIAVASSSLYGKLLSSYIISMSSSISQLGLEMKSKILDNFSQLLFLILNEKSAVPETHEMRMLVQGSVRDQIIDFIRVNLPNEDLTPQYIADKFRMSLRTLYYLFDTYDVSLANLIRSERLKAVADDVVRFPRKRISEIAYSYGFTNTSHFSRVFRQELGLSPRDYRKSSVKVLLAN